MKTIFTLFILAILSVVIYYGLQKYKKYEINKNPAAKELIVRDKAIDNLKINIAADSYSPALYVTADWESHLTKIDVKKTSVRMDCVITRTKSGHGKKIIATTSLKGLSQHNSGTGSLTCYIKRSEISRDKPFLWVRIVTVINGKKEKAIVKYLGEYGK